MAQTRRFKVKGVRKREFAADDLALVYWLLAKQELRNRRQNEVKARAKRKEQARRTEGEQ